ncbi:hypothetical protein [Candidatus Enterococcus clewellii]|uniref:Uncharacterized protein n=1 Tax=Candidatus Enterococcus clewellii TaxID=1834193 RepID=A0A242K3C4_9ENTE|nr:hypothetical protein [Enterococcus sp. 9E7_DIV0242]OTP13413.1 hypothetical protein A5888_002891 [Enterococcus sp. 9E7_DIV0242]
MNKDIFFQGSGYRILAHNDLNVVLETEIGFGDYKFQGYYSDLQKALSSVVRRDLLMKRDQQLEAKSYLAELEKVRNIILADIKNNLTPPTSNDLSLDDLLQ